MLPAVEHTRPRVAFIGSVVAPGGIDKPGVTASAVALSYDQLAGYPDAVCHYPQTPQSGLEYTMDHEAALGFPFLKSDAGKLVYQMVVKPDLGGEAGAITFPDPETEGTFEKLELKVLTFLQAVAEGEPAEINHCLFEIAGDPSVDFDTFRGLPPGLQHLITRLRSEELKTTGGLKGQISGPINSAFSIHTLDESGGIVDAGKIIENSRLLTFHSGLILARSMIWAMSLKPFIKGDIYFSFDEPGFENIPQGKPTIEQVQYVYSLLWANPEALPYKRFVHVCGSLVPEVMPYVDYLNFDALTGADLLRGHESRIKEFFTRPDRPGHLVLGITPTNLVDLLKAVPQLSEILAPSAEISERFAQISDDPNFIAALARLVEQYRETSSIKISDLKKILAQYHIGDADYMGIHRQLIRTDDDYRVRKLMKDADLQETLKAVCKTQIAYVIRALTEAGLSRSEVLEHILISPQCGLGPWHNSRYGAQYSQFVYNLTRELAASELH